MSTLNKKFESDQYLEETNILIVNFTDGTTLAYDLTQRIPDKIRSVVALENHLLQLEFINGEEKYYNMSNRLTGVFSVLKDIDEFKKVKLVQNGKAVGWMHQGEIIDIWTDSLYFHSYPMID